MKRILFLLFTIFLLTGCNSSQAEREVTEIILATTTSTQDSGLLDVLVPLFEEKYGVTVKTIAVGTGQALAMGEKGEADVLLTHAPSAEETLVEQEAVINRKRVMYNDFIVVGPASDPAQIYIEDIQTAFSKIYQSGSMFVSRGDDSGTHKMELSLWEKTGFNPVDESWYVETGQGMGSSLQVAAEREGYILTDRATYLAHKSNYEEFIILVEGDKLLLNIYHVMQVNPDKHSLVNGEGGQAFVEFLISENAQEIIADFGVSTFGEPLFFPYTE